MIEIHNGALEKLTLTGEARQAHERAVKISGDLARPIDIVLIDGPHAYPFPDLEYYYFYPHIVTGGLLIIDAINIPSIRNMAEVIKQDAMSDVHTHTIASRHVITCHLTFLLFTIERCRFFNDDSNTLLWQMSPRACKLHSSPLLLCVEGTSHSSLGTRCTP